ncbi:hypothetical protein LEN26_003173 [Aphanomyces euteiches]|nr:hypothetical protein AeMF1_018830 [Aphanomyces euteiches]KAH9157638.1 hypothetical protein LEN26_003173 [Aphanomyces euteiches]
MAPLSFYFLENVLIVLWAFAVLFPVLRFQHLRNECVGQEILRPILLVFDGLSSHYSEDIVSLCNDLDIILMCLPANATHLFQPLDICVFSSFKNAIRRDVYEETINDESGDMYSISKEVALKIASSAWIEKVQSSNMISGFKTAGIWPLSYDRMMERFKLFQDGGVPSSYLEAEWMKRRDEIRHDILCLPPSTKKRGPATSKTIDVAGRVLTMSLLQEIDATKEQRRLAREQATKMHQTREKKRKRKSLVQPPLSTPPENNTTTETEANVRVFVI